MGKAIQSFFKYFFITFFNGKLLFVCLLFILYSTCLFSQDFERIISIIDSTKRVIESSEDPNEVTRSLIALASHYREIDNIEGIKTAEKALKKASEIGNDTLLSKAYFELYAQYYLSGNQDLVDSYLDSSIAIAHRLDLKRQQVIGYIGKSTLYDIRGVQDSTEKYFKLALEFIDNDSLLMNHAILYNNYARFLFDKGKYEEGKVYIDKALNIDEASLKSRINSRNSVSYYNYYLYYFNGKRNLDSAIKYLDSAIYYSKKSGKIKFLYDILISRSDLAQYRGNYKKAIEFLEKRVLIEKDLEKESKTRLRLIKKFIKESEQNFAKLQIAKKDSENNRIIIIALVLFAFAVIVFILIYINKYRITVKLKNEITEKNKLLDSNNNKLSDALAEIKQKNNQIASQFYEMQAQNSELISVKQSLEKSLADKDKLFSIISHDLKNPVSTFRLMGGFLLQTHKQMSPDKLNDQLKMFTKAADQISDLTMSLLDWARSNLNQIEYNPTKLKLNKLIDESINVIRLNAEDKGISIQYDENSIELNADYNMIKTVIRNLVSNAVKFTNEGGLIKIQSEEKDNLVILKISDNGIGMTSEQKDNLFDFAYFKSKDGTRGESGTGLGLMLCKQFIDTHKGKLEVESELGKGTTFIIELPSN